MKFVFESSNPPDGISIDDWHDWGWQLRHSLKTESEFLEAGFHLSAAEREGFTGGGQVFQIRTTPYYASLASRTHDMDPIRRILMPTAAELSPGHQAMADPLAEKDNNPAPRIIHRYPDRVLFLVTDTCSVYCRYCTRKHFTGHDEAFVRSADYEKALTYIRSKTGLREVILSGGDPLTLGDRVIQRVLSDLRSIDHVEIIRIGSRMPVVCPMRVTSELASILRGREQDQPVYMMTHFNHPREVTLESASALRRLADHGLPIFNQLVLLNGVNNHPAVIQALSRRLLSLRTKPYYMFQCDPSEGTDHLRTSVEDSLEIQRQLWGNISGLAMPNLSLDIPGGGGKAAYVPNFEISRTHERRAFKGWDGVEAEYVSPPAHSIQKPLDAELYAGEWNSLRNAKH